MKNWSFGKLLGVFGGGFLLLMVLTVGIIMAVAQNKKNPGKKVVTTELQPVQVATPSPSKFGIEGQLEDSDEKRERRQLSEDIRTLATNQQILNDNVNSLNQKVDLAIASPGGLGQRGNPYEVRKVMAPSLPREARMKKVALPAGSIKLSDSTGWNILAIAQGKAFLENEFAHPLTVSTGDFIPPSDTDAEGYGYLVRAIDEEKKIIWVTRVTEK